MIRRQTHRPHAPEPAQTQAVFLVLTTAELKDSVGGIVESVRYRVKLHPSLEAIRIVGPLRPSRTCGEWLAAATIREMSVWRACATAIPEVTAGPARICSWASSWSAASQRRLRIASQPFEALRVCRRFRCRFLGLSVDGEATDQTDEGRSGGADADGACRARGYT